MGKLRRRGVRKSEMIFLGGGGGARVGDDKDMTDT